MSHEKAKCYAGRCKCLNIVAATVIDLDNLTSEQEIKHRKRVAKDVAQFIREGLTIEKMEVEEVRESFSACTCPKPEKVKKQKQKSASDQRAFSL